MKIISLGMGQKIFEKDSAVRRRQVEYGNLFECLHLIVFSPNSKNFEDEKLSEKVFLYPTKTKIRIFYLLDFIKIVKRIIKIYEGRNFILTAQDPFETGIVGVVLKILLGVPLQIQLHTDFNNKYFILHSSLNFIRLLLAHITLPFADSVRCVSERVAKGVREINPNVSVLPISQDLKLVDMEEKKEFKGKLLTVCRLEREKDLETAIRAFAKLSMSYPEATFTIAGDGSQKKRLELLAKSLGVEDRIKFVGWHNDLSDFYKEADIYISTSLFEGYGMSMVEAALHGLPLILSEAGIAEEYFKDNGALLCKPKDVDTFYRSLLMLFKDEESRTKMGSKARRSAESKMVVWQDYLSLYKKDLEDTRSDPNKNKNIFSRIFYFLSSIMFVRYFFSGITSAGFNIGLLYVFTDMAGIWYLYSSIIAFVLALFLSFVLQKFVVFRDSNVNDVHKQFSKFSIVAVLGVVTNTAIIFICVDYLGIWYILSQIIAGFFVMIQNFILYKIFIFKK